MFKKIFILVLFLLPNFNNCFPQVNVEWFSTYDAGFPKNFLNDFVMDSLGNSYMTGNVSRNQSNQITAFGTVKFNSTGELQWVKVFEGSSIPIAEGNAVTYDKAGNVYATGTCTDLNSGENYCTVKFNSTGDVLWIKKYHSWRDFAVDIVEDNQSNIYVTGFTEIDGNPNHYFWNTIKYDSSGNQLWVVKYEGDITKYKRSKAIILDTYNNVYVCGFTTGSSGTSDFCTIKYDSAGNQQWISITDIANLRDEPSDIQIDNFDNIYVLGQSYGNDGFYTSLVKYNSDGNKLWSSVTDSTGQNNGYYIRKNSFKLDQESKNIYIATTYRDYCCTIKYDSNGVLQWLSKYKSAEYPYSKGLGINIDRHGDIYTTGLTIIPVNVEPFLTLKYRPDGTLLWDKAFHVSNNLEFDQGAFVEFDKSNNVYIAGIYADCPSCYKYSLLKYSQGVGISNISSEIPSSYTLYQNFPNPFNPKTIIRYEIPVSNLVTLKVYDILGNEINTLVNEKQTAGTYEADFDGSDLASGVYYYKLSAGNFSRTKRMLLLK